MSTVKISELTAASALDGTEQIPVVQGGSTKRTTAAAIAALGGTCAIQGADYAKYLAASLEPDAIESLKKDAFSFAVASNVTKLLMASWNTRLGSTGRMEQRNPERYLPLRGVTLNGIGAGACAVVIDPALVTYADPWAKYYERLQKLHELPLRTVALTAASQKKPLLPGAYGGIIVQYTCFDSTWLAIRPVGDVSVGYNLGDEESDTAVQRIGGSLKLPIAKRSCTEVHSGVGASTIGSVSFILCPSDWSAIADPLTYIFRDDFMGASLDTGVWTRTQSAAGNVEIDTQYQWLKIFGAEGWGTNGLFKTTGFARSGVPTLIVDCYMPQDSGSSGSYMVGWQDGAGISFSDFAHAVNFAASGTINVYENGTNRGTVGSGWTAGAVYRVKIKANADGTATYSIQGGAYGDIGGESWTNVTPGTTSSATATVHPGATAYNGTGYISDMRVV